MKIARLISRSVRLDRRDVTSLEFALISSLITLVMIGGFAALASQLGTDYNNVAAVFPH